MITWRALCNATQNVNDNVTDFVAKVLLCWFYPYYIIYPSFVTAKANRALTIKSRSKSARKQWQQQMCYPYPLFALDVKQWSKIHTIQ